MALTLLCAQRYLNNFNRLQRSDHGAHESELYNGLNRSAVGRRALPSRFISFRAFGLFARMDLPVRKKLSHAIPQWVPDGSWFFITIKCVPQGKNQLCRADIG